MSARSSGATTDRNHLPQVGVTFRYEPKVLPYESALHHVGLHTIRITPDVPWTLDKLSGLVLTGGTDVNPARYGQTAQPRTDSPDDQRDELEIQILKGALRIGMPVLCICRGLQVLNVVQGGSLIQDLATSMNHAQSVSGSEEAGRHPMAHTIQVLRGTQLANVIGEGCHEVNSRHHQAIDKLGTGLKATAWAEDGTVEAVELRDKDFVLGTQWHPEDQTDVSAASQKLFQAFASVVQRWDHRAG